MLSQRAIDEVMAEFWSHFTPEQVEARNQRLRAQALEADEREELYRMWGGPPLGQLIEAEKQAKELAARKKVELTIRRLEPPGVPFEVLLGTIRYGAWRSPLEMAAAYSKGPAWVRRLRSVVIAEGYMSPAQWRGAFANHQWK